MKKKSFAAEEEMCFTDDRRVEITVEPDIYFDEEPSPAPASVPSSGKIPDLHTFSNAVFFSGMYGKTSFPCSFRQGVENITYAASRHELPGDRLFITHRSGEHQPFYKAHFFTQRGSWFPAGKRPYFTEKRCFFFLIILPPYPSVLFHDRGQRKILPACFTSKSLSIQRKIFNPTAALLARI